MNGSGNGEISNAEKGAWFEQQVLEILGDQWGVTLNSNVPIPIGDPPKAHRFDLVSDDGDLVIECKSIGWTETGNVPSAKMGHSNEAVFYLTLIPNPGDRYLALPNATHPDRKETIAQYYWRTYRHLLGKIQVLEIDLHQRTASPVEGGAGQSVAVGVKAAPGPVKRPSPKTVGAVGSSGGYWVYENYVHQYAKIHRASCSFCNYGRGLHPDRTDDNSRWLGPFDRIDDALDAAKSTRQTEVNRCGSCAP